MGNATVLKLRVAVTMPVILVIGEEASMTELPLHATATAGKNEMATQTANQNAWFLDLAFA
jgi:hypothetical protein